METPETPVEEPVEQPVETPEIPVEQPVETPETPVESPEIPETPEEFSYRDGFPIDDISILKSQLKSDVTFGDLLKLDTGVTLSLQDYPYISRIKYAFYELPIEVRSLISQILIVNENNGVLGTSTLSGVISINQQYFNPQNEIESLVYHEAGHVIDGRVYTRGSFDESVDANGWSYSLDKNIQPLLQKHYPGMSYYDAYAHAFNAYMNAMEHGVANDEIVNYFTDVFKDMSLTHEREEYVFNQAIGAYKSYTVEGTINNELEWDTIMEVPEDEQYLRANSEEYEYRIIAVDEAGMRWNIPLHHDSETVREFNTGKLIDQELFRLYFMELLNNERLSKGLVALEYDSKLEDVAEIRATELAEYGNIRVNNLPHTRLDGARWSTALNEVPGLNTLGYFGYGENLVGLWQHGNPYALVSEKYLAEQAFDRWKNSPSHYANMMDVDYVSFGVSIKLSEMETTSGLYPSNMLIAQTTFGMK